jgi:micrococcal nuclease
VSTRGLVGALAALLSIVLVVSGDATAWGAGRASRRCVRVVDGDTIVLDGGEKVRLIGVDTPELHHPVKPVQYFAREARDFVYSQVQGRDVHLEFDQMRRDRYGRTLAYVFLADGTLLNELIIERGYGFAYVKYPFRSDYMARFRAAEARARSTERGLWK